jgi:GNAT superfamily N-acetyltransferase
MEYEIVKYAPEFKPQVVKLQTHLWGPDIALNSAYLEWKYERNPYMKTPFIHLALRAGDVVGMRGMCGAKWQIGHPTHTFLAPCAGDLVLAPDHRNRGLVAKIMETAVEELANNGYAYVFNFSAGLATQLGSLTTGWRSVGPLDMVRFRGLQSRGQGYASSLRFARNILSSLLVPFTARKQPFYFLDGNSAKRRRETGRYVSVEHVPHPEAMAELVERIGSDGRLRHVRDQEYFVWRFQNPLSRYRFFFWRDTALEGYLVLRTSLQGKRVSIVDWEATNQKVRADLLQAVIQWGKFNKLVLWTATLPPEVKTLLHNTGFRTLGKTESIGRAHSVKAPRPMVLLRAVQQDLLKEGDWVVAQRRLLDLDNWDLRMIYADNN